MRYLILLISWLGVVQAAEVDFSKAYLLNSADTPLVLNVAGVRTINQAELVELDWILALEFNPDDATFRMLDSVVQNPFDVKLAQQRLRDTVWHGEYRTTNNLYQTELHIKAVQAGFVGAEVIHTTVDEPEPSSFLHVKLAGDIESQYLIDEDQEGELDWVYVTDYEEMVVDINEKNETKREGQELELIPDIIAMRHLMRLKRGQIVDKAKHASSSWGTFNEYRLAVENNKIIGSVGKPPEKYSDKDALIGNGKIELTTSLSEQVLD